ncbi:T9SS type A sorting domain-containing protein [Flammeovirgaceae bacterium SG7u.111]|nr:T9SS type A sorting domain-containing protein [Flammeovirgaceae bacterium SG7u.132]WPO36448.1 T9SS type A sorting domain-containing protein [Flammeovirgaceae bacterium SG7u.111]
MDLKKICLLVLLTVSMVSAVFGQIEEGGIPLGFNLPLEEVEVFEVPLVSIFSAQRVSVEEQQLASIGEVYEVGARPEKDGKWTDLPNGNRLWQFQLELPGAEALGLYFRDFYLPEGAKLFIYNKEKTMVLGAFTSANNQPTGLFSTRLLVGEAAIIEYYEPAAVSGEGHFEIAEAGYVRKGNGIVQPESAGEQVTAAGSCNVNVECEEGEFYSQVKSSVVRILVRLGNQIGWCSGVIVNNTNNDLTPYVLTAQHCGLNSFSGFLTESSDFAQWIFYFNYESPICTGVFSPNDIEIKTMVGATPVSESDDEGGDSGSDFLLLQLNESIPQDYKPVFAGWDRTERVASSGASIHHPDGDVKKISTFKTTLTSSQFTNDVLDTHWRVIWTETANGHGITEGGSSGAPLFNEDVMVIGTLSGGNSSCSDLDRADIYGKFSYHWDQNGTASNRSLGNWLDPTNTGVEKLRAINYEGKIVTDLTDEKPVVKLKVYPNPASSGNFKIETDQIGALQVQLFNISGKVVYSYSETAFAGGEVPVSLPDLSAGIYLLKLESKDKVGTAKIVLE